MSTDKNHSIGLVVVNQDFLGCAANQAFQIIFCPVSINTVQW